MKNNYYVLRAKDCFGDTWPLLNRTAGIDGVFHETLESAKAVATRFKAEKELRTELRLLNGWQQATIRGLEICEVTHL